MLQDCGISARRFNNLLDNIRHVAIQLLDLLPGHKSILHQLRDVRDSRASCLQLTFPDDLNKVNVLKLLLARSANDAILVHQHVKPKKYSSDIQSDAFMCAAAVLRYVCALLFAIES